MRAALRLSLAVLVVLAAAQPALAAPPPTLTNELLLADNTPVTGENRVDFSCRANGDGTVTVLLETAGESHGAYEGTFDERVEWKVRSVAGDPSADLLSLRADFTIRSSTGQISGIKRLPAPMENAAYPNGACVDQDQDDVGRYIDPAVALNYSATIISSEGVFADHGSASLRTEPVDIVNGQVTSRFTETFSSSLTTPERRESALFGQRTPGGSFSAMSANTKRASPFTLYFPATVRKLYAYVDGGGAASGSQAIRGLLYRNAAGGGPGAYVTQSFEFTIPAGMSARWVPLYLAPVPRLDPGVYWIGIQSGTTHAVARFAWNSKPNSRAFNIDPFTDGASDPFGAAAADDQQLSILAVGSY